LLHHQTFLVTSYKEDNYFFEGGVGVEGGIGDVEQLLMAIQVKLHFRCTWCTEGDILQDNSNLECPGLKTNLEKFVVQILF
jgi:hypothetical protein